MKVVFFYSGPAATQKFLYSASILNSSIEYVLKFSQIAATNYIKYVLSRVGFDKLLTLLSTYSVVFFPMIHVVS